MDFQPTQEQDDLRAGVRALLARRFGREALRASVDRAEAQGAGCVDRGLWRELGGAGFFALRLPEADGGVGLGLAEAVLAFEEAGRALLPGPLVATHLAAGRVEGAADGTAVVTAFDLGDGDRPGGAAAAPGVLVAHLAEADALLGGGAAAPAALLPAARPVPSADPLTPLHRVPPPGREPGAARLRDEGALLTAALQLGSALRTLELAVRYAGEREQFGRPIGAFQAVQHLCSGMLVRAEVARTAVYAAAVRADAADRAGAAHWAGAAHGAGGSGAAGFGAAVAAEVAGAKLLADRAAVANARDCLQVHGGMGFTWDADVHLHLKRAWVRAEQWRTAAAAEEALAAELLADAQGPGREGAPFARDGSL
ncbi:acyl-CoA dehydrogenase family protein [Streptomyces globosus]|uniref:acyl-CoA dehydrogenase family protein n=1 Tax=Streptomyces globosus TaxID=68209 RepID=UPI0037F96CCC